MNKLVAVTIGDIKGVGIEILIKEWKRNKIRNFILISNYKFFKRYLTKKNISIQIFKSYIKNNRIIYDKNSFNIFNISACNNDQNSINSLKESYTLTKNKFFIGILTLPINKKKLNKINRNFIDQTTFFTKKSNKKISNMIFIYKEYFFIPLTTHIELKKVSKQFKSSNKYIDKIKNIHQTIIKDFGIIPKIIIAGINPHVGEDGIISKEDKIYLSPILKQLNNFKIKIFGPVSPDGIINKNNLKNYNCFVFTHHDQALIPFKMISNYSGVNFTSNLDVIRVSPDHGTAYDMIESKHLKSNGILNSFKLIKKIYSNRNKYDKT